ncbi:MAG TPA: 5'-nucleotidase C-terminal domain-containing protein [Longimicrobium sp.]|nr:5'-nucleotidase C-terminal domain-containing protein [Longimicrobium sp.]
MPRSISALVAALLLAPAAAPAQDRFVPALAVVQVNDVYRVDAVENGAAGGLGRVVTLVERTRRAGSAPVMVFHAGDFIAPSLESKYFRGAQMIDALNFVAARAPMLVVPGNHEFDANDPAVFRDAVRGSRFPWLAGNLTVSDSATPRIGRDTVFAAGGIKVGVFTLTFLDAARSYASADTGYVAAAERQIRALERRGADVIVGITHLDHARDREVAALRRRHPRFLWIAGGHEHFLLRDELTDSTALITKGDSNARRVWRVLLGRDGRRPAVRAEAVVLDSTVETDPAYEREVTAKWVARVRERIPTYDVTLAHAATPLDGTEETVRNSESTWGSWLADRMRRAFPGVTADVAVLNGGSLRMDDVIRGPIRWEHVERTFGFPTAVGLVWLRGRDLREAVLENSVSGGRGEGRFLQVSGLRFTFDRTLPAGRRVTRVEVRRDSAWAPLEDDREYVVAVPDYLFANGDGYAFTARASRTVPPGPSLKWLAVQGLLDAHSRGQEIAPRLEGRITELNARPER